MRVALVENKSDEFLNSRLRYALFLKNKGHQVVAVLPNNTTRKVLEDWGLPETVSIV